MSKNQNIDVFFSYNSSDRKIVEAIARKLSDTGIDIFLDRWYLVGGTPWPQQLEQVLSSCNSAAVF